MNIANSTLADLPIIFEFYDFAVAHQRKLGTQEWKGFEKELIKKEIAESRQYKILINGRIVCIFMVTFSDPQIWPERSNDRAIYLHRIVTHPNFRGLNLVRYITDWAIGFAKNSGLDFVRMDTWADNEKLNNYYLGFGFKPAGTMKIAPNSGLPNHYEGISLSLFEIDIRGLHRLGDYKNQC